MTWVIIFEVIHHLLLFQLFLCTKSQQKSMTVHTFYTIDFVFFKKIILFAAFERFFTIHDPVKFLYPSEIVYLRIFIISRNLPLYR